jgi:hypothetical protein
MFENFGWKKNPMEKRTFVDPKTAEPVVKLVVDNTGNVVGSAETLADVAHAATEATEDRAAA